MFEIPLVTSGISINSIAYWDAIAVYHNRPHLVNRKVAVADQVLFYEVNLNAKHEWNILNVLNKHALAYEIQRLKEVTKDNIDEDILYNLLVTYDKNVSFKKIETEALRELENSIFLSLRIIIPRMKNASKCVELVVLDKSKDTVTFFSTCVQRDLITPLPNIDYQIQLGKGGTLKIAVNEFSDAETSGAEWLADALFPKLMKWTDNAFENNTLQSLTHVSLERYCDLYNNLKIKYGEPLRKVWWEKTKTDPQKFIFEDIAIATYLICIWIERYLGREKEIINFVDCGCGNGLLVYILSKEGFKGYGIDIRKRNVWDFLSDYADLRVGVVGPDSVFPNATWLIGNHSDELTPWLPVIAMKSSPETNFFVLPCCPFDFNGRKYVRVNTRKSQYADYLDYIEKVSEMCCFKIYVDKLRIPSTKRICLIGVKKEFETSTCKVDESIESYISLKFSGSVNIFIPRPSIEKVRNCTQIDQTVKDKIVKKVVDILLKTNNPVMKGDCTEWNQGGEIHLRDLSKLLNTDLIKLKKECGGLQTLLRNHRYLFEIKNAIVFLRKPYPLKETSKYKDKPCWYNNFHPEGCLFSSNECGYKH